MGLPEVTHLQFLILETVGNRRVPGRAIRDVMREHGVERDGPGFYQAMARLEVAGLVRGIYRDNVERRQQIRERYYEVTDVGRRAVEATITLYRPGVERRRKGRVAPR
jgi:DNA-binding PadR family transcriptional regulator